ncbi:MAG: hypothetical protein IKE38_00835 [Erysipelotrichaceae bacterium]|nr:hypothetical protein [Erysipelotrichaceae bacterium]
MNPKIIYPVPKNQSLFYRRLRYIVRILFLSSGAICDLINIIIKGKDLSVVVIWSLFILWESLFSLKLVEFSGFSHAVRILLYVIVLLGLIDHFLAPGWSMRVIPIVFFGFFLIMFILYFAIHSRKDRHLMSIVSLGIMAVLSIPYSLHSWPITDWLAFSFMCATSVLFVAMVIICRKDIARELKNRFKR